MQSLMKAVKAIAPLGPPSCLQVVQVPIPTELAADQVLIRVGAAGVNRPDVLQRKGLYPPPKGAPDTLGLEVSGQVVKVGSKQVEHLLQRNVCGLVAGGGYAEYCVANASSCLPLVEQGLPVRDGFSHDPIVVGAAFPETVFTVWKNLFSDVKESNSAQLQAGQTLLVHGGTSGIGTTAIQLAKARGLRVFATAGSDEKVEFCTAIGAQGAVNYKTNPDWVENVKELNGGRGVDCVLDYIGGDYAQKNLDVLNPFGTLVVIGFLGSPVSTINMTKLLLKSLRIRGSVLRSQPNEVKAKLCEEIVQQVWPLVEQGKLAPFVADTAVFDGLEKAEEAHALMESSSHMGKIVLKL